MDPETGLLRVLHDAAAVGAVNMARDEALLLSVGAGESPPTLRLYEWSAPTISLGYFQPIAQFEQLPAPERDLAVVRRMTGGGAILHDWELTYSLAFPTGHAALSRGQSRLYELAHDAIATTLRDIGVHAAPSGRSDDSGGARGPFFCFVRRHEFDLLVGADKIVGSAQRRTKGGVLQHGSIVLASRFALQPAAVSTANVSQSISALRARFPAALAELLRMTWRHGEWSIGELASAEQLQTKYAGDAWIRRT